MVIYKTTNLINGKIYVGLDTKDNPEYFGSGILISRAIEKYGKANFKKEILARANSIDELNQLEIEWIAKLNSRDKLIGYNITEGGEGVSGYTHSAERRKKISDKNTGVIRSQKFKDAVSKSSKERWADIEYKDRLKKSFKDAAANRDCSRSKSSREKQSKTKSYSYRLTAPDGEILIFENTPLRKISKQLNLSYNLLNVAQQTNSTVKPKWKTTSNKITANTYGWRIERI